MLTLHEIVIDGEHAWVTANKNMPQDLVAYGGAYNGALIDSAVQEYDLKTGKLERNWDALDHIPLSQSQASLPTNGFPWDAYHVNSIQLTGEGKFLVSMRDTLAAYLVDIASGRIEWTLGGRDSSFKFGPGAEFEWQHDVMLQPDSTVSVFDDHCCRLTGGGTSVDPTGPSRGLVLKLDQQARKATLVAQYGEHGGFRSEYMGDTQPQSNGNVFVGWGSEPYFSEYDKLRQAAVRRRAARAQRELPRDARAVGRRAADAARRRGAPVGRQDVRLRELERRHAARPPGGCSRARAPARSRPSPRTRRRASRRRSKCRRAIRSFKLQALDAERARDRQSRGRSRSVT